MKAPLYAIVIAFPYLVLSSSLLCFGNISVLGDRANSSLAQANLFLINFAGICSLAKLYKCNPPDLVRATTKLLCLAPIINLFNSSSDNWYLSISRAPKKQNKLDDKTKYGNAITIAYRGAFTKDHNYKCVALDVKEDLIIELRIGEFLDRAEYFSLSQHNFGFKYFKNWDCLLYTSPSPRDGLLSRMPSSA